MSKHSKTILIVDDDPNITRTFARILEKNGYQTETAQTGKEAIQKASAKSFDVALIDMRLSDCVGTELLDKLDNTSFRMVKIIITGLPIDRPQRGVAADAYLLKPVRPEELLTIIEEKIRNKP